MTAEDLDLAESILKITYDYKVKNISYERQSDRLVVWSNYNLSETSFTNLGLMHHFQLWTMYIHIINNRVSLVIF